MKILVKNGHVDIARPDGTGHSMSLEQYEKHARDPAFVESLGAAAHAEVLAAIAAAKARK